MEFTAYNNDKVCIYAKLGMVASKGKLIKMRPKMQRYMYVGVARREERGDNRVHLVSANGADWQVLREEGDGWMSQGALLYRLFFNEQQANGFANTLCIPNYVTETSVWCDTLNPKVRRLQRWVKQLAHRKAARLALAMALHPRLGIHCALAELGRDCVALVGKLL
jgi:hypothetical protein